MNKQIEEMTKDIKNACYKAKTCSYENEYRNCDKCRAKYLLKLGYRKIDKDSIVISREEYQKDFSSQFNKGYKKGGKETAEKIFEKLLSFIGSKQKFCIVDDKHKTLIDVDELFDFIQKLEKQYGTNVGGDND